MSPSEPPSRSELDGLFRSGAGEARREAMDLALLHRAQWDKRWGGLFLRWARTAEADTADFLGARLLGPLWLAGEIEPRQLVALSLWPSVWPWRTGLLALTPSLQRNGADWPLFEQFAKACLGEDSRFGRERQAFNGLGRALRAAKRGCPELARSWLDRHEPVLQGFSALEQQEVSP